jgi:hypothetical protein
MTVTEGAKLYGASGLALGREEFLKGLSGDEQVSVLADGAYDSSKNIFTASTVRLQGENSTPGVKVEGLISDAKSTDQTFGLTLTGYEGLYSKPGAVATIAITPTTVFFDTDGKELPGEGFFAAIGAPRSATVSGTYDAATNRVLAASVKLGPMVEKPKPKAAKR